MKVRFILALCAVSFASLGAIPSLHASSAADGNNALPLSSKVEAEQYFVEMSPVSSYKVGEPGAVAITIIPKPGYHINAEYPYKFKAVDPAPDGLAYPKPVLRREDGSFTEQKGAFQLPLVAAKSGAFQVAGTLSLSVCSESSCISQKLKLETPISVK